MSDDTAAFRRIIERRRPKVEQWIKERINKVDLEFQNEVRGMTWEELFELHKKLKAQAEKLELRAWFAEHVAMRMLAAENAALKKDEAA